ncbi:MAG: HAD family hydrolase [Candidatus Micrarchaeota archaeon]|nr:HAD family hydrolase [Candidatus Micrarchaeota archaeon]
MIKAIIFDMDGVLLDTREANIVFFQREMERSGYGKIPRKLAAKGHTITMMDSVRLFTGERSEKRVKEIWQEWVSNAEDLYPSELVAVPSHVKYVLERLSKKYKTAIVTGRIRRWIGEFFKHANIKDSFDALVGFEDYKKPKPDPEPLLVAAKRLRVASNECIYVGDSKVDELAARAAGMKFIMYHGFSKTRTADHVSKANDFKDLLKIIEMMSKA